MTYATDSSDTRQCLVFAGQMIEWFAKLKCSKAVTAYFSATVFLYFQGSIDADKPVRVFSLRDFLHLCFSRYARTSRFISHNIWDWLSIQRETYSLCLSLYIISKYTILLDTICASTSRQFRLLNRVLLVLYMYTDAMTTEHNNIIFRHIKEGRCTCPLRSYCFVDLFTFLCLFNFSQCHNHLRNPWFSGGPASQTVFQH